VPAGRSGAGPAPPAGRRAERKARRIGASSGERPAAPGTRFDPGNNPVSISARGRKMDLMSINTQLATAVAGAKAGAAASAGAAAKGFDFAASLDSALQAVSRSQAQSEELQKQFQLENPTVSLEQTMVSMNKSALAFSAAVQVRNRLVQAYDQIMNMQV
jgi:flagellar hook-basal body complex protein FliE